MTDKPTAIFAINDKGAIEVMEVLQDMQISIPEEMSVVGYDNLVVGVPLTTVAMASSEIGEKAAELLMRKIEEEECREPVQIQVEPQIVIRGSSSRITLKKQKEESKYEAGSSLDN